MKRKNFLICLLLLCLLLTGCSWEDEADVASYNISKEADNFNVYRKVTVINNQSDVVMLEFEGWCSITKDNTDNQLEITYRVGEGEYYKDFVGLNDRTSAIDAGLIPGVNREILRNGYGVKVYNGGTIIIPKYIIQKAFIQDGDVLSVELQDNNAILLHKISSLEKK